MMIDSLIQQRSMMSFLYERQSCHFIAKILNFLINEIGTGVYKVEINRITIIFIFRLLL